MKTSKFLSTEVYLLVENELKDFVLASKNLNPMLTYVKFILTDDKPNANGMKIPKEEFANLIRTGLYMPLKMSEGEINDHADARPLGVIVHLREDKDKIRGVAALWNEERPEDVAYIQERYAEGKSLDLSWELGHTDSFIDDDGIENLTGCVLRATTLVGIPAYQGRTIVTEVESSSKEDKKVEKELEKLRKENEELKARISELEKSQLTSEDEQKLASYDDLAEFKATVEKEAKRLATLQEIKDLFKAAGLDKDEEFFEEKEDKLLALKETDNLNFLIDELKEKKEDEEEEKLEEEEESEDDSEDETEESEEDDAEEQEASTKIPNVKVKKTVANMTGKELGAALRNARSKS